jgi:hypothetical protein
MVVEIAFFFAAKQLTELPAVFFPHARYESTFTPTSIWRPRRGGPAPFAEGQGVSQDHGGVEPRGEEAEVFDPSPAVFPIFPSLGRSIEF